LSDSTKRSRHGDCEEPALFKKIFYKITSHKFKKTVKDNEISGQTQKKYIGGTKVERRILLLAFVQTLIISGVCGLDVSFAWGSGGENRGYGCHLHADDGVDLLGQLSLQESNLAGNFGFKGVGELNVRETRTNGDGDSVSLMAKGRLLPGNVYDSHWYGEGKSEPIIGFHQLTGTGRNIDCMVRAQNRDGLKASVAVGVGRGSIDVLQSGTAFKDGVDAWQEINSASGDNIELYAKTSDKLSLNMADSSVKVDYGQVENYRSEAEASLVTGGNIDLYAIHGHFNIEDNEEESIGSISGNRISSEGLTFNQKGLAALYSLTINCGSIEGRFDWGTEAISNDWVIAVPLESPGVWGGTPGKIGISALKINSYSAAFDAKKVLSKDWNNAKWVNVNDWHEGYGFAEASGASKT
jgi:hypothetical protein